MSELEKVKESEMFVVPLVGEAIDLAKPGEAARAWLGIKQAFAVLNEAKHIVEHALAEAARTHGAKTFRPMEGIEVEVREDSRLGWDMDALEELRAAGLPEERWDELVQPRIEYSVSARVASQLERSGNEEYARIIRAARQREDRGTRVYVKDTSRRR